MAPQLTQAELDRISDNALDHLIEATMSADFDDKFNALMAPIAISPDTPSNTRAIQIAEAAFAKGYKYGYSSARLDLMEELRHSFYQEPS
jgi:hypothetical protein